MEIQFCRFVLKKEPGSIVKTESSARDDYGPGYCIFVVYIFLLMIKESLHRNWLVTTGINSNLLTDDSSAAHYEQAE